MHDRASICSALLGEHIHCDAVDDALNNGNVTSVTPRLDYRGIFTYVFVVLFTLAQGDLVAEWLVCWTQVQKARLQIAAAMLSSNTLRQTVHTHRAFFHQAAKLVAALLRVARVTAGLAESSGSLPPGL